MQKSLSNATARQELLDRLERLSPESARVWGTMTAHQMLAHLEKVARGRQLRPDYGDGSLEWLAGQLGEKRQFGALEMLLIRNDRGVTGWFICFLEAGGIGQVVQVAAEPFQMAHVLDQGLDRYRRTLGRVTCGTYDANTEQVRRGRQARL